MIIHPTAEVSGAARIGEGTRIWHQAQVREGAAIGRNCIVGKGVYVDFDVSIGDNVKIQNGAQLYHGVILEDGVFIGPLACLTNDRFPRRLHLMAASRPLMTGRWDRSWCAEGHRSARAPSCFPVSRLAVLPWWRRAPW